MKRNITSFLKEWSQATTRKPLIIRGARQIGKTYSVDLFGKEFENYLKVDFEETPSLKKLFDGDLDVIKITSEICAIKGLPYKPKSTLLFFDEIQNCPNAIKSLRYFYEKSPDLYVIAAGSLLEFSLDKFSFPVGRVCFYWMFPMTFKEFLTAQNKQHLIQYIPNVKTVEPVPSIIHENLLNILREYYIIGGMPEVVKTFVTSKSYTLAAEVQRSIILSYVEDIVKYHPYLKSSLISDLFYSVAKNVGKQIKYTSLIKNERSEKIKSIIEKFYKTLIAHPVYASNGEHPFKSTSNKKLFKIIFLDIGLMQNMCGINYEEALIDVDLMATYGGALAEQFVGQEMIAKNNVTAPELYYWTRQKQGGQAEIDFLLEKTPVLPIEVKSVKSGRLRSMHLAINQFTDTSFGVVLSLQNISVLTEQKLKFLPLYSDLI